MIYQNTMWCCTYTKQKDRITFSTFFFLTPTNNKYNQFFIFFHFLFNKLQQLNGRHIFDDVMVLFIFRSFFFAFCFCLYFGYAALAIICIEFIYLFFDSISYYYEFSKEQDYICSKPTDSGMHMCSNLPPYRIGPMICNGKCVCMQ